MTDKRKPTEQEQAHKELPPDLIKMLTNAMLEGIKPVELKCEFIMIGHWFIDMAKITHSYIDSARIMLSQMGGNVLIFDNDELVADVTGNVLNGVEFRALADYLRARFNAEDVLTPVDRAFGKEVKK